MKFYFIVTIILVIIMIFGTVNFCIGAADDRIEIMNAHSYIFFIPLILLMISLSHCQTQTQNDYKKCLKLKDKILVQEENVYDIKLMLDLEKSTLNSKKSSEKIENLEKEYIKERYKLNKYIKEYNREVNKYNSKHNDLLSPKITTYHNQN